MKVGINEGVGLKIQLLKNIHKVLREFHSEHKDISNCSFSHKGCFTKLYIRFSYRDDNSYLVKSKLKGNNDYLDLDDLIIPKREKLSFLSSLLADLESSSNWLKNECFYYQMDCSSLEDSTSFYLRFVTLPKYYIKLINWLSAKSEDTLSISYPRSVSLFGKRGRYSPVVDSAILTAEYCSEDHFKDLFSQVKSKYKSGDIVDVIPRVRDEGNLEDSTRNETEYYGGREQYYEITIRTPKTYKLKLGINL